MHGTLTRRRLLRLAGAGVVTAATVSRAPLAALGAAPRVKRWSDPATWGGRVPGPKDVARIRSRVLLDRSTQVAGVHIAPGGHLIFDPSKSRTLRSTGNVV